MSEDPGSSTTDFDPYKAIPLDKRGDDKSVEEYLQKKGVKCIKDLNDPPQYKSGNYYQILQSNKDEKKREDSKKTLFLPQFEQIGTPKENKDTVKDKDKPDKAVDQPVVEIFILDEEYESDPPSAVVIYKKVDIPELKKLTGYGAFINLMDEIPATSKMEVSIITVKPKVVGLTKHLDEDNMDEKTFFKIFETIANQTTPSPAEDALVNIVTNITGNTPVKEKEGITEEAFENTFKFKYELIKEAQLVYNIHNVVYDFSELLDWQIDLQPTGGD
jgi:hypothetical protein